MRFRILALAAAGALALSACETTGPGYGSGYGSGGGGTQLSRCTRQALMGAGVGAVAGALIGSEDNRVENAALGAAAGGLGTYGVCRWLSAREQQRVEQGYYNSLNTGRASSDQWRSDQGSTRNLSVSAPQSVQGRAECRRVSGTVRDPQYGNQQLPPETFCRNAQGQWVPA
jgi:surface antigen